MTNNSRRSEQMEVPINHQQILEKAISKAIDGGWTGGKYLNWSGDWMGQVPKLEVIEPFPSWPRLKYTTGGVSVEEYTYPPTVMLFDHDFAKALWGTEADSHLDAYKKKTKRSVPPELYPWKHHLREMVISDDPIKYLGENI